MEAGVSHGVTTCFANESLSNIGVRIVTRKFSLRLLPFLNYTMITPPARNRIPIIQALMLGPR